tara:strand:+ start:72 stop:1097 length:1026 start_codon:yes stop_codon:yes gene_type:complete
MVKKTKKNEKNIGGNIVTQELKDTQFIKNWEAWVKNCEGISDIGMKQGGNLYDFLQAHVTDKRPKSDTKIGEGTTMILDAMGKTILAKNVIGQKEIDLIKRFHTFLEDQEGGLYDPANIKFTEKTRKRGRITSIDEVFGHWNTKWYAKKKGGSPVPESWYSYSEGAARNPPHLALYSTESGTYSKPKGLMYILEDALEELEEMDNHVSIRVMRRAGKAMELNQVRAFLDKLMVGNAGKTYFKEGKIQTRKIRDFLATKVFKASPNQEALIRELSGVSEEQMAGDITTFDIDVTETVIEEIFTASRRKKAGGFFIYGKKLDKRPRRGGEPVAKSWMDYLWVG